VAFLSLSFGRVHKQLFDLDERNYHIMQTKGDLHERRQVEFTEKQEEYERLLSNTNTLADLLDKVCIKTLSSRA
jgi:hypothetical protein